MRGPGAAVAAVFAAVALVPLAGGARSDAQTLYVTFLVTGGFKVALPDGTPVGTPSPPGTTIPPGTYELVFDNTSNVKNVDFQLTGPNVSLQEDMGGGEETAAGEGDEHHRRDNGRQHGSWPSHRSLVAPSRRDRQARSVRRHGVL